MIQYTVVILQKQCTCSTSDLQDQQNVFSVSLSGNVLIHHYIPSTHISCTSNRMTGNSVMEMRYTWYWEIILYRSAKAWTK